MVPHNFRCYFNFPAFNFYWKICNSVSFNTIHFSWCIRQFNYFLVFSKRLIEKVVCNPVNEKFAWDKTTQVRGNQFKYHREKYLVHMARNIYKETLMDTYSTHLPHIPSSSATRPINLNVFSQNVLVWEDWKRILNFLCSGVSCSKMLQYNKLIYLY